MKAQSIKKERQAFRRWYSGRVRRKREILLSMTKSQSKRYYSFFSLIASLASKRSYHQNLFTSTVAGVKAWRL